MKHRATKARVPFAFAFIVLWQSGSALAGQAPAAPIPAAALMQPADLAATLKSASVPRPLVLHVGFHVLYMQAHIPASEYVGPASEAAGLQLLRNRVAKLHKDAAIVIYCGCCPWSDCPNISAAFNELRSLGFTNVKAVYFAESFGKNWVDHGYPVAKGG
jgi:thiosulfate/3-mercaptopyruvate sulfurtransferase